MSNRNQNTNQTIETLLFNYLLNYADIGFTEDSSPTVRQDLTANPLTDRNVSSLLRVFDSYQRNVEIYHRNMREFINLLRTNMNTSREPPPVQPTSQRENRSRPWNFGSTSGQPLIDPSNNAIPPVTTRSPTYSNSTSTSASRYAIPPVTTRTPTYSNSTSTSTSSYAIPPRSTQTPTYSSSTAHANNRLTRREIESNVSTVTYSSDETETRCPISFEDFCVGESICKINNCGHIFKREPIYQWLNNHNTCPVCRANVLPTTTSNTQTNIINEYSQYIAYTLLAGLNTNPSNIQTYTFDLPLYYDISGNTRENQNSLNTGSSNITNNYDYIVEEEDED